MELWPVSVEDFIFVVTARQALDGIVQATLLRRTEPLTETTPWYPAEWLGDPAPVRQGRILLAGMAASAEDAGGAVRVSPGRWRVWTRFPETREKIVRPVAGWVISH